MNGRNSGRQDSLRSSITDFNALQGSDLKGLSVVSGRAAELGWEIGPLWVWRPGLKMAPLPAFCEWAYVLSVFGFRRLLWGPRSGGRRRGGVCLRIGMAFRSNAHGHAV